MSALPPKADMCSAQAHVRFVPIADSCTATNRKTASRRSLRSPIRFGHAATVATFRLMHFRVYFQSTGALSGVSEFRLGAGW